MNNLKNIMDIKKGDELQGRYNNNTMTVTSIIKENPFYIELTCVNHLNESIWRVYKADQMLDVKEVK